MNEQVRILLLEDTPADVELVKRELCKAGIAFSLRRAWNKESYLKELKDFTPELILSDYSLTAFDGMWALAIANEVCPVVPFIFVTDSLGEERAVETLKSGAADYILKDRLSRLVPSVQMALNDIRERKIHMQAEEALQYSAALLEGIFASAMDAIIIMDSKHCILRLNNAAEKMFRCSAAEAIGQQIKRYIPGVFDDVRQRFTNGFTQGRDINRFIGEQRLTSGLRSDGEEFPVEALISRVRTAGQDIYTVILRDATGRKRAEEKIREQAELLDKARDAIIVRDLDDQILYWNKSAERLYGWSKEEAIGKNAYKLLYKAASDQVANAQKTIIEKGEWSGALSKVTKQGKEIMVESHWTMVYDAHQAPKSILVIDTDITENRKLEAQFLHAQRMESIGTLAGGIAHDLNNVLQPIMMALQILQQRFDDEKSLKLLDTLEKTAERGANLVKQVLSIARGFAGDRTVIQVGEIISEIEKMLEETFPKSIRIKTKIPNGLWTISGDPTQVHQVLMNLCVNARDAMPNGGVLNIFAENLFIDENYARMVLGAKVGPYVLVDVADTGEGIPPEILEKIFEPFFTTKEFGKGTGLGLSTVFGIAKSHGGFINVYSEIGQGTSLKVYLPAISTSEREEMREEERELPLGNGELILVVDDEASIREITKMTLEACNYSVITAKDGDEAISLFGLNKDKVKTVIIDSMMPVMDGQATVQELRKIDIGVKVIAASGLVEKGQIIATENHNIRAFLWKPFTAQTLLRTLHEVLSLG